MLTKVLKITTGGLVILGGYVFAYKYGYVRGLLDLQMALEEDYKKRSEAEEVLEKLRNILTDYGSVTVVDYKELIGIISSFKENKLGWTDLSNAEIIRSFDGWTVVLPKPKKLD